MLEYPQIKGRTPQEQVAELQRYIIRLVDDCNYQIETLQDQINELKKDKR